MTTPVFTEASDAEFSQVSIKICLPLEKDISRCDSFFGFSSKILKEGN